MHATNCFHVVRDDLWARITHSLNRTTVTTEVADQNLHRHSWARLMHSLHGFSPNRSAAVAQLIAIHTRDDNMLELHECE